MKLCDSEEGRGLLGRKLVGFIVYVLAMTFFAWALSRINAPADIVIQGLWMITAVGGTAVGGQALIDSLVPIATKWADAWAATRKPPEDK